MSPERTCIGCRRTAEQAELLRLAVDRATGAVAVDHRRRMGGRGVYLHPDPACIAAAERRRAAPRGLRAPGCDSSVVSELAAAYAKTGDIA